MGQIDFDDNFQKVRPYQTYIQYKGSMGKWNLRGGHYILPFGLLSSYDTERLLIQTIEMQNLGIKLDTGLELFGFLGHYDYAISLSQGVGRNRLTDVDNDKLLAARVGWEDEDIRIGISSLTGRVLIDDEAGSGSVNEKRLGFDITKYYGQAIFRSELIFGEDGDKLVGGGFLGMDYALSPKFELNLKYTHWQKSKGENFLGIGLSYNLMERLFFRIADNYKFGKEEQNEVLFQIYWDFLKTF